MITRYPTFYVLYMEFGWRGKTCFMENGKLTSLPTKEYFKKQGYKYRLKRGKLYLEEIK